MAVVTQAVVICAAAPGGVAVAPCGTVNGVPYALATIDQPVLSAATVAILTDAAAPFDYNEAGGFFALGIGPIIALYWFTWGLGVLLRQMRNS